MKKHTIVILVFILTLIAAIQTVSVVKSRRVQAAHSISSTTAITPVETLPPVEIPQPVETPAPTETQTPASQPAPTTPKPAAVVKPTSVPIANPAPVAAAPRVVAPTPAPAAPVTSGSNANPSPKQIDNVAAVPKLTFADCSQSDFNSKFLCLINNYRAENGKNALRYDSTLNKVAYNYSAYMQSANFFGHVGPDGSHYYERCAAAGTTCHAENLAEGFLSAQNLFDMWRSSPGHNANMLGPYTTMGLGISGKYATNVFRW